MTPDLIWLTLSALLASALWIPYIVGVNRPDARAVAAAGFSRPADLAKLPAWVHRAHRAHLNMIETFVPFAAVVLIAHVAAVANPVTLWACMAFFGLRLVHAAGMIGGWARMPLRPILFTASWLCTLAVAGAVLTA